MAIENIEVANQITEAIATQNRLLAKSTREMKDQLVIAKAIMDAQGGEPWDNAVEKAKELRKALEDLGDQAEDTQDQMSKTRKSLEQLSKGKKGIKDVAKTLKDELAEQFPVIAGAASGFFSGAMKGFSLIGNAASAAISTISALGAGLFSLGKSIIAIPFKILGGLVDMANSLPNDAAFAKAREAVRKDFGTFSQDISKNIRGTYKGIRGEIANTGLSTWRVMGTWAERLEYIHELFKGLGPLASLFGDEIKENGEAIVAYQKALGISHEQMKGIAALGLRQGRELSDVLNEITIASTGMADQFGISHKVISRDMAEMMEDVGNFGSMTAHEMSKASVYVRKLGLEIKEVVGLIDKYDNFEDAAMGAANLAQAFGANVDALEMMREQDPSKRLDMLRKSMAAAGVDAERLSRQELKLLAQHSGLSEEAAKAAFALKNQGVSMADLEKQQGRNEKKTMTQEEAMVKLSDSIERMIKTGQTSGGFFTQFFKGFERGVKFFSPFRRLLRDIRRDLRIVRWLGIRTGQAFVRFFPGVMDMVKGMREFFDIARFRKLKQDLTGVFNALFKGKMSLESFITYIKDYFTKFIMGTGAGKKIYEGFLKFGSKIVEFLSIGLKIGMSKLADAFDFIAEFIKDPSAVIKKVKEGLTGASSPFVEMLMPLWDSIQEQWPRLRDAFINLWDIAWPKLKELIKKIAGPALKGIAAVIFAPAMIQGVFGAAAGGLAKWAGKAMLGMFTGKEAGKAVGEAAARGGPRLVKTFGKKMGSIVGKGLKVAGPIGLAIGAALGVSEGMDRFMDELDPTMNKVDRKMAAAGAGIISSFTFGLLPDELEVMIAKGLLRVQTAIMDGMEALFGKSFVDSFRAYLEPVIQFWQGLGDIIGGLLGGDTDKVAAGVANLVEGAVGAVVHGFKFMIINVPIALAKVTYSAGKNLIIGIIKGIIKMVPEVGKKIADLAMSAWEAIKKSPENWGKLFAGGFAEGIAGAFGQVYDAFTGGINDIMVDLGITGGAAEAAAETGKNLADKIRGGLEEKTKEPGFFGGIGKNLKESGTKLFQNIGEKIDEAQRKQSATASAFERADQMSKKGISLEDMSLYQSVKRIKPARVKAVIRRFRKEIIPLFIGKTGESLMDAVRELSEGVTLDDRLAIGNTGLIIGFAEELRKMMNAVISIGTVKINPAEVVIGMANVRASIAAMQTSMMTMATAITDPDVIGLSVAKARIQTVGQVVEEMVASVNETNNALSSVDTGNKIKVKLRNLAKGLGVKNQKFEIKNDKVKMYVKVDVQLDTETVAAGIKDGGWFVLQPGHKTPQKKLA